MKRTIKKVFVPHKKHNPQPLFWHPLSIGFFVLAILFVSSLLALQKIDTQNNINFLGDIRSGAVISFTNKERADIGLSELIESQTLNQAASLKAQDMAQSGYFAHYSPAGLSPWFWFTKAGYEYERAGENLAVNFDDSKKVVYAWMNSPTHKANIVKEGYTEIGIGTAEGVYKGKNATFVVQLFAKPKTSLVSNAFAFAVEKKIPVQQNEQASIQGAEVMILSISNILEIFSSQAYLSISILALLSLIIIIAIIVLLTKWKHHNKKFYFSLFLLSCVLLVSIFTQIFFLKDISITFL